MAGIKVHEEDQCPDTMYPSPCHLQQNALQEYLNFVNSNSVSVLAVVRTPVVGYQMLPDWGHLAEDMRGYRIHIGYSQGLLVRVERNQQYVPHSLKQTLWGVSKYSRTWLE